MADDETYYEAVKNFCCDQGMDTAKQLGWEIPEPKDKQLYAELRSKE